MYYFATVLNLMPLYISDNYLLLGRVPRRHIQSAPVGTRNVLAALLSPYLNPNRMLLVRHGLLEADPLQVGHWHVAVYHLWSLFPIE